MDEGIREQWKTKATWQTVPWYWWQKADVLPPSVS